MRHLQIGIMGCITRAQDRHRLHALAEEVGRCIADHGAIYVLGAEGHEGHLPNGAYRGVRARGGWGVAITTRKDKALFRRDNRSIIQASRSSL